MEKREIIDRIKMEEGWKNRLLDCFLSPKTQQLREFLLKRKRAGATIYPPGDQIFSAFDLTPFDKVRGVILGQDPYHGENQAHGLCFSVGPGIAPPPSLKNIFKELQRDLGIDIPSHGSLIPWAKRGIFLTNAVLTVEKGLPASHRHKGWEELTDMAIMALNREKEGLFFLLWGKFAMEKAQFIDEKKHLVLRAPHPSPLSAFSGFFGCGHFSKVNDWLARRGESPIDWTL